MKPDTQIKTYILLNPGALRKAANPIQLLQIEKSSKGINYETLEVSKKMLQEDCQYLHPAAIKIFLNFQERELILAEKDIETRYKKNRAGTPYHSFLHQSMLRHIHSLFQQLLPYQPSLKFYHRIIKPGTNHHQTLGCRFSDEKPRLSFNLEEQNGELRLQPKITLNQTTELKQYRQHSFLLESENIYYLLSFKDHQTLDWLEEQTPKDKTDFVNNILARIEQDYKVERNGLLEDTQLIALPKGRVMLSELNNAFLLLTPQWLYDGFVVEGAWADTHEVSVKGERIIIKRDKAAEEELTSQLRKLHPKFETQNNGYFYLPFAEAQKKQWFIKTYYELVESDVEIVGMDLLKHFRYSPHTIETEIEEKGHAGNMLEYSIKVRFGKENISISALQKALYAGQRAIVLKDGSLGILNDNWLQQYGTLIKHARIKDKGLEVSQFLKLTNPEAHTEKWKEWQKANSVIYEKPANVNASLRPYQQKGFEWMALLAEAGAGACLADDMGLGKTLQTICFLAWHAERYPEQKHLIVCPTSLLYNWKDELQKFAPGLSAGILHGGFDEDALQQKILITTYGTLRSQSERLLSLNYGVAVLDESHNIKNPSAQITRVVQQLNAVIRIALSGTPVVNNTFDLYSQLSFVVPGLFGSREFFKREYADPIDRWSDEEKIKALQKLTGPFILRRTKEQVVKDLPGKTETVLWCNMSPSQREVYEEMREQIRGNLFLEIEANGLNKTKLAVLQGLMKLRQICNHPQLLPSNEHAGRIQSAKTGLLMSELENLLTRHKVLVFSQFSSMLALLADAAKEKGMNYHLLDGQTPAAKRMEMVREFQEEDSETKLFLISLKAGNTGLTLTAADYVFLFDPWWNTAVEQQAVDRTHRIGQTRNVFAYKLICKDTIEEKILELQKRKKQLAEELITAEEDFVKTLGEEEISYLFG